MYKIEVGCNIKSKVESILNRLQKSELRPESFVKVMEIVRLWVVLNVAQSASIDFIQWLE